MFLAAEHSAAAEQEVIGNYMYYGTSSTSLAVASSGTFTLDTQTGLSWVANDKIVIWSGSSPANWIAGVVTSYSGTTIVFEASSSSGAGTYTDWRINLASGTIQHRHGYASEWEASNPVLLKAEIGVARDDLGDGTVKFKIGDGVSPWMDLPYQGTGSGVGVYAGSAVLSSGFIVVNATWVTAVTIIVVTPTAAPGTAGAALYVDPADIVAGTSFTIRSDDATDSRTVFWMASEPNPAPLSPYVLKTLVPSGSSYPDNNSHVTKDFGARGV